MANVFEQIAQYGIVPLVTLDDPNDAIALGNALVEGGIPVAEVTFRTEAGGKAIELMAKHVPNLIVGAGTVHDVEHAKITVDNGGKFIITPGFNREVVKWCVDNNVPVCPGTVVPSDIEEAMSFGLKLVKFFPAEAYGGIDTLKALYGPFASIKFVPTGGVGLHNLTDYLNLPNVAAVGGSFVPPPKLVKEKDWAGVVATCKQIMNKVYDFTVGHVGINAQTAENAKAINDELANLFDVSYTETDIGYFTGQLAEILKVPFVGTHGHICVDTRDLPRAIALMERKGVKLNKDLTFYDKNGKMLTAYLEKEVGGFALHIRQRPPKK